MKEISFYVPCFNAEKYIAQCIESIINQTYPLKEIILVDDGSKDNSLEIVSKYKEVKIVKKEKNEGLALARNKAIEVCSGDYIASCDSDVVLDSRWLENIIESFSDEKVGGAGGKLLERNQERFPDKWRAFHLFQHWGEKKLINPRFIYGANTIFRRDILLELGKYNELFKTNREDLDMCQRVKKSGYKIVYEPSSIAEHIRTDTIQSVLNTFYGWKRHDYRQTNDFYENFSNLWGKILFSTNTCYDMLLYDINNSLFDLIYITFLILFRFILRDVRECKESRDEPVISDLIIKNILLQNNSIKTELSKVILEDISDCIPDEKKVDIEEGLKEEDFFIHIKNSFGNFNMDFIKKLYRLIDSRLNRMPALIVSENKDKPSESRFYSINRAVKEKIKGFIQDKTSSSSNFMLWEKLRMKGERINLDLRHKSYEMLDNPSEEQSLFFWNKIEESALCRR